MRVVVFGATGDQGRAQVRSLARAGHDPLAVSRNPLRDAARRLIEEGFDPKSELVIRDCHDAVPEQRSTIAEALKL